MRHETYGPKGLISTTQDELDLDVEKENVRAALKESVGDALAPTDWYVTRAFEDPTKPIPADILAARKAVRDMGDTVDEEIEKAADLDTLQSLEWSFAPQKATLDQKDEEKKKAKPILVPKISVEVESPR